MKTECNQAKLLTFIKDFFYAFNAMDADLLLSLWQSDGRMRNIGNSGKIIERSPQQFAEALTKWKTMPEVSFTCQMQEEPHSTIVDGLTASIEVRYHMLMPDSVGEHTAFFHLVCDAGEWKIVSLLDRGFERARETPVHTKLEAGKN